MLIRAFKAKCDPSDAMGRRVLWQNNQKKRVAQKELKVTGFQKNLRSKGSLVAFALLLGAVGACAAPGYIDNPIVQKGTWFSYLDGGGLRDRCGPAVSSEVAPVRYRLIYNADYLTQVRIYEIAGSLEQGGEMTVTVKGEGRPFVFSGTVETLFDAWHHPQTTQSLTPADMAALQEALRQDGAYALAPDGERLPSYGYYWVVNGCDQGQTLFNAYRHPGPRFAQLRFPKWLKALDQSSIDWEPAQPITPGAALGRPDKPYVGIYDDKDFQSHQFEMVTKPKGFGLLPGL